MSLQSTMGCLLAVSAVMVLPGLSRAEILAGSTVATTSYHGTAPDTTWTFGPTNSLVGAGVELEDFGWSGFVDIDFSDTAILITANNLQPFGYLEILRFSDVNGTIPDFTGVTLGPATNWAGFDASRISRVDADSIDLNLTGLQGGQGQQIALDLTAIPVDGGAGSVDDLVLGEVALDHQWRTLSVEAAPPLPVVMLGPPTYRGADPGVGRLRSVSSAGFDARFQEWDFRLRDFGDNVHVPEKMAYLVLEQGRHLMSDGSLWEAGTLTVDGTGDWHAVFFAEPFQATPYLFLTAQTENDDEAVSPRARSVMADGFEVALFEEEALMDGHAPETIGYLAVFNPSGNGSLRLDGADGAETPYHLRSIAADHHFTPAVGALIKVEEEQSLDDETDHVRERVDVLVLGIRVFAQQVSSRGGDTTGLRRCVESCP